MGISALILTGCGKPVKPVTTLSEAEKKFLQLCRDDYQLTPLVRTAGKTLWIYLPSEDPIIDLKASKKKRKTVVVDEVKETYRIQFLDGQFKDGVFHIQYDIALAKNYAKDYGYSTSFSDTYQSAQRNILTALSRAYGDLEKSSEDNRYYRKRAGDIAIADPIERAKHKRLMQSYAKQRPVAVPDIIILVVADITKGIETRIIVAFDDLMRSRKDYYFQEEFTKRVIMDYPQGNPQIVGDTEGNHLDFYDMPWGEFLIKQILYRINFRYTRSAFPPSDDTLRQLLEICYTTINAYHFEDFTAIELHDLRTDTRKTVPKAELSAFKPKDTPSKGRLHTIRFF